MALPAFLSTLARLGGAAAKFGGRAAKGGLRFAWGPKRKIGALRRTGRVGGALLAGAGAALTGKQIYDVFSDDEMSSDEMQNLETQLLMSLASDPTGKELYNQRQVSDMLEKMRLRSLRTPRSPEEIKSEVQSQALRKMIADHEETLLKNAITESKLSQSGAFNPSYSDIISRYDELAKR